MKYLQKPFFHPFCFIILGMFFFLIQGCGGSEATPTETTPTETTTQETTTQDGTAQGTTPTESTTQDGTAGTTTQDVITNESPTPSGTGEVQGNKKNDESTDCSSINPEFHGMKNCTLKNGTPVVIKVNNSPSFVKKEPIDIELKEGIRKSFEFLAQDEDLDELRYFINNKPSFAEFNETTGELTLIVKKDWVKNYLDKYNELDKKNSGNPNFEGEQVIYEEVIIGVRDYLKPEEQDSSQSDILLDSVKLKPFRIIVNLNSPPITNGIKAGTDNACGIGCTDCVKNSGKLILDESQQASFSMDGFDADPDELTYLVSCPRIGDLTIRNDDPELENLSLCKESRPTTAAELTGCSGVENYHIVEANALCYKPGDDFHGGDRFTFLVYDNISCSEPETVPVRVNPQNRAPETLSEQIQLGQGKKTQEITLKAIDREGDSLEFSIESCPQFGELFHGDNNICESSPMETFLAKEEVKLVYHLQNEAEFEEFGLDEISFMVSDGDKESNPLGIIKIEKFNPPPVGQKLGLIYLSDKRVINEKTKRMESNSGKIVLIGSDENSEADNLSFLIVSCPKNGTLMGYCDSPEENSSETSIDLEGNVVAYAPNLDYIGEDQFTYRVFDGNVASQDAVVSIKINHPPEVSGESFEYLSSQNSYPIVLQARDIDGDELFYTVVRDPQKGRLSPNCSAGPQVNQFRLCKKQALVYIPQDSDFSGEDSFIVRVSDGFEESGEATIQIRINSAPQAESDNIAVLRSDENQYPIGIKAEDKDFDALTYEIVDAPGFGELQHKCPPANRNSFQLCENFPLIYEPGEAFEKEDQFTFRVSDGIENSQPATISIRLNKRPKANNQRLIVNGNKQRVILIGSDEDEDTLTYKIEKCPEHGELHGNSLPIPCKPGVSGVVLKRGASRLEYIPNKSFSGDDSFTFSVLDGYNTSNIAQVQLNVIRIIIN